MSDHPMTTGNGQSPGKTFICPKCNFAVPEPLFPTGKKSEPRCSRGHSLEEVLPSFGGALLGGAIASGIGTLLCFVAPGLLPRQLAFLVWGCFLLFPPAGAWALLRGLFFSLKPVPTRGLAPGNAGLGLGLLLGSAITIGGFMLLFGSPAMLFATN